jgi:TPR repeat protein
MKRISYSILLSSFIVIGHIYASNKSDQLQVLCDAGKAESCKKAQNRLVEAETRLVEKQKQYDENYKIMDKMTQDGKTLNADADRSNSAVQNTLSQQKILISQGYSIAEIDERLGITNLLKKSKDIEDALRRYIEESNKLTEKINLENEELKIAEDAVESAKVELEVLQTGKKSEDIKAEHARIEAQASAEIEAEENAKPNPKKAWQAVLDEEQYKNYRAKKDAEIAKDYQWFYDRLDSDLKKKYQINTDSSDKRLDELKSLLEDRAVKIAEASSEMSTIMGSQNGASSSAAIEKRDQLNFLKFDLNEIQKEYAMRNASLKEYAAQAVIDKDKMEQERKREIDGYLKKHNQQKLDYDLSETCKSGINDNRYEACIDIAIMYRDGTGKYDNGNNVEKDLKTATEYFRMACKHGKMEVCNYLDTEPELNAINKELQSKSDDATLADKLYSPTEDLENQVDTFASKLCLERINDARDKYVRLHSNGTNFDEKCLNENYIFHYAAKRLILDHPTIAVQYIRSSDLQDYWRGYQEDYIYPYTVKLVKILNKSSAIFASAGENRSLDANYKLINIPANLKLKVNNYYVGYAKANSHKFDYIRLGDGSVKEPTEKERLDIRDGISPYKVQSIHVAEVYVMLEVNTDKKQNTVKK